MYTGGAADAHLTLEEKERNSSSRGTGNKTKSQTAYTESFSFTLMSLQYNCLSKLMCFCIGKSPYEIYQNGVIERAWGASCWLFLRYEILWEKSHGICCGQSKCSTCVINVIQTWNFHFLMTLSTACCPDVVHVVIKKASLYFGMTFSRRENHQLCRKPLTFLSYFSSLRTSMWKCVRIYIQLKYCVGVNVP